jgi:aryl-alcohol dehydrogenase-like predicted oxidoreductase
MHFRYLGNSGFKISEITYGNWLTHGSQLENDQAHACVRASLDAGITTFDTADVYANTMAETVLGEALKGERRESLEIFTKVFGPTGPKGHNDVGLSRKHILESVDGSLSRLQTDYIDLYQLHWTERTTNNFGRLSYVHKAEQSFTPFAETLAIFADEIKAGRIRAIGLSNESAWGTMRWMSEAERLGLPRMASIQNAYSLVNRSFEVGLAEVAHREDCGLLAYSPLAMGALSGKYLDGSAGPADRLNKYPHFKRYRGPHADPATAKYVALARAHGLDPAQMALAFVNSRPFVTSNIIGATTTKQLESNIASADLVLSEEVVNGIEAINKEHTYPCP